MTKHKSKDYKLSAVKYYLKSKNASETCQIFECSSRSLMGWVKKYQTSQSISQKISFSLFSLVLFCFTIM